MAIRVGDWKAFGASQPHVLACADAASMAHRPTDTRSIPSLEVYRHHRPTVSTRRTQRSSSRRTRSVWRSASARRRQRR